MNRLGMVAALLFISMTNTLAAQFRVLGAGQSNMAYMDLTIFQANAPDVLYTNNLAVGGSTLTEWEKGSEHYNSLVHSFAVSNVPISAILWWQGEAEGLSTPGSNPCSWSERFTQMIRDLKADTGKDFKVVMVKIGLPSYGPPWDEIRHQQDMTAFLGLRKINIDDVPRNDGVHYDADAYTVIAIRLANAYNGD